MGLAGYSIKPINGKNKILFIFLAGILFCGCNFSYDNGPKRPIEINELVGVWENIPPLGETVRDTGTKKEYPDKNNTLNFTLNQDKSYKIHLKPGNASPLPSDKGKWLLEDNGYYKKHYHYTVILEKPRYISSSDHNFYDQPPKTSRFEVTERKISGLVLCVDNIDANVCFERRK